MPYSLIVFDWDGTLMDSTGSIVAAIQGAARDLGLPVPTASQASWVIGLSLESALYHVVPGLTEDNVPRFLARYHAHYSQHHSALRLFEGVHELLNALTLHHAKLAVATAKSRAGLDRVLAATGLGALFNATRCAEESCSKPHPPMLIELMQGLEIEPNNVLMVGDTTHDMQMAANAGVAALGVSYGAHSLQDLQACNPQAVVESVSAMHAWLLPRVQGIVDAGG
jgi:phosphoglycolate phosphatase